MLATPGLKNGKQLSKIRKSILKSVGTPQAAKNNAPHV
jgi:hypothetical protein